VGLEAGSISRPDAIPDAIIEHERSGDLVVVGWHGRRIVRDWRTEVCDV
jgi:hypothetical protein